MPPIPWPDYIKAGESLTVDELLTLIENRVASLKLTVTNQLDKIATQADHCRLESGLLHEPVDEHANRDNAYDDLKNCRDALDLISVCLQAAENDISHVGGGGIRGRGGKKKATKKSTKKRLKKKKVAIKKPPKPKPNPRVKKTSNKKA
jgi:hypothetical protein